MGRSSFSRLAAGAERRLQSQPHGRLWRPARLAIRRALAKTPADLVYVAAALQTIEALQPVAGRGKGHADRIARSSRLPRRRRQPRRVGSGRPEPIMPKPNR